MTAADLMNDVVEHTRAMDESFTAWDGGDRKAAAEALGQARVLDQLVRRFHDQLTEDVQAYDREHGPHDPRD